MSGTGLYFHESAAYRGTPPGLPRLNRWLWMTALTGTTWMRSPSVRMPWRTRFYAGLGAWALFGLPVIIVFSLGVWFLWFVTRLAFLALAVVLTVGLGLRRLARRAL